MEANPQCYDVIVKFPQIVPNENRQEINDKLCIYFQSKKGGDCDVECVRLLWEDADGSWFKVFFVDVSGASNVLARSDHKMILGGIKIPLEVQGCQAPPGTSVSSSLEVPPDSADLQSFVCISQENLQDSSEEYEQLIEVTGLKRSTDIEVLKLYFENPRKSGGGEIKLLEREPKTGAISITFKDQSVTSIVAGKKHKLSGAMLDVKLITKKKRCPLPIKAQCLFLEGIPDGCSSEHVKIFIENRASMIEEPTIQYGEKPGTALCTFSRDIPDLEDVIRKISQRKLKGALLKAEKVHHSDAIFVQGVSQDLEMVELYFDNKKKSGGGGVTDVQPGPMDGQAIVYFDDWKVVQDILTKGHHKLGGNELRIESYHDFLGRLSLFDAPTPHIPKPVSVGVQEPVMEFLYGKGKNAQKKLLKELTKVKANLQWPDGSQKSQAKLEPVIDDSQHQSSWLNWEKKAVNVLTDFMKGYKTTRVPVPQSLWKDAVDKLKKIPTTCSMVLDAQLHEVILVGEQKDVDFTEATIIDIIMKLQKEAEYDSSFKADCVTKEENLEDDPEEDEQLIEVTGLKSSTDIEFLKLYFENPRKSGGGEIKMLEREPKTGAISITFKDQSVTSIVAGKKHKLSGAMLNVKLITKKKRRPLPIKAQCLFLEGIPDGCSSEHVKLFIENRASMIEEPTIQYGEKPGTALCTFSRDMPDLEDVIRKISQRKFRGALLKAEKVHHSDAILVQGVSQDLEMVELYFENKKKSGGSGVTDVQPGPMDGQAIVYFEDWKVVQDILTKGHHKFGGNELRIESYHDFLGRLSLFDAPTPHIPKPVSVGVQEPVMEFLYGKGKNAQKKLLEELTKVKANLQWPDGSQKSQAKLEPVIDDSQHQSSWLNWEKEAVNVLTDFMKGYKTTRVSVPQSLWKDAVETLKKIPTTCSMVLDTQFHGMILVGEQKDVDVTDAKINDIIIKLQKEAEYLSSFKAVGDTKESYERGSHDLLLRSKQGDQFPGYYPSSFSPAQLYLLQQRLPFTQASRLPGNYVWPIATHQLPTGNQKQTLGPKGTSASGMLKNATDRSGSGVKNTVSGLNVVTKEGMFIKLTKGNIAVEKVDVIVNTTGSDFNLKHGKVSHAISLAAGPTLQQECDELKACRGSVASWSFKETGPGLLTCKRIYHCVCEGYKQLQSEQLLKKLVVDLMLYASRNGMTSMAIPALGTGLLSYPPAVTACCMYEAATEFSSQHPNGSLKDVHFVVYDKDMNTIKGFEEEIQRRYTLSPGATGGTTGGVTGNTISKLRKKKKSTAAARFENPTNWITMNKGELTKIVTLTAGTVEYRKVRTVFRSTPMGAFNQIVEIQRVQNQDLLAQYRVRKAALETRLKRDNVEKVLYHGTDEQTCNDISRHGFNRGFSGKNAAIYGNGTYFAVQAGYSARFAKPNARGIMHIVMAKVLVGDYTRGCQGINAPPKKQQSPGELYDSVVDNVTTPGIYVIFHDAQAYPEYIIKFQ